MSEARRIYYPGSALERVDLGISGLVIDPLPLGIDVCFGLFPDGICMFKAPGILAVHLDSWMVPGRGKYDPEREDCAIPLFFEIQESGDVAPLKVIWEDGHLAVLADG